MLNRLQEGFASLEEHKGKYGVIGGIAAVLYGVPRATFDLIFKSKPLPKMLKSCLMPFLMPGVQTTTPGITFKRCSSE